jgi:hypothetical protein
LGDVLVLLGAAIYAICNVTQVSAPLGVVILQYHVIIKGQCRGCENSWVHTTAFIKVFN